MHEPGPARVLALVYGFFTLAAGARSAVQLATHASHAPVAYTLSALAAMIYLLGTVALVRGDREMVRVLSSVELGGVPIVGTASLLAPSAFPDQTVWSGYGIGYGLVPLAQPLLALLWVRRTEAARDRQAHR